LKAAIAANTTEFVTVLVKVHVVAAYVTEVRVFHGEIRW
jgi:hypothetical protein